MFPLYYRRNTNILFGCIKLIEYSAFAFNVASNYPCVGPSPRIKISLFLLSTCTDELITAPEIVTFIPTLPSGNKNS